MYKLRPFIDVNKLNFCCLSQNPNPNVIEILKQNPNEIDWQWLSANPCAIELLEQNPDKINWVG